MVFTNNVQQKTHQKLIKKLFIHHIILVTLRKDLHNQKMYVIISENIHTNI